MQKYGVLIEGMQLEKMGKTLTITTAVLYILRKLIVAVGLMSLLEYPVFTIFLFNFSSLFMVMFIVWVRPFEDPKLQRTRVVQEIVTMLINYTLFCFTDWVEFEI